MDGAAPGGTVKLRSSRLQRKAESRGAAAQRVSRGIGWDRLVSIIMSVSIITVDDYYCNISLSFIISIVFD